MLPEKKRKDLSPFLQKLSDILNFKQLLIEKILKALYVFLTCCCIFNGFFMIFSKNWGQSYALPGFLLMLFGPIIVRLLFEGLMLSILLVKNTIEINKKIPAPEKAEAYVPDYKFCVNCGTKYDAKQGGCPNGCG